MSYCGACGTFYNPACTRWPQCAPAPNPHEERNANLFALATAAFAEVIGMAAENQHRAAHGLSNMYGEDAFNIVAEKLRKEIGSGT